MDKSNYKYIVMAFSLMVNNPVIAALVSYDGSALPASPWVFISNGPASETSQHSVSAGGGTLRMTDTALLTGNTLGYLQNAGLDSTQVIDVEFRARVFYGESAIDSRAPFDVWLYDGLVRADMAVGPDSVTALGWGTFEYTEEQIQAARERADLLGVPVEDLIGDGTYQSQYNLVNQAINGDAWHTYGFRLTPANIYWYVDGLMISQATRKDLIEHVTTLDRRINMMITSATADVELDYLTVSQMSVPIPGALSLFISGGFPLAFGLARSKQRI